MTDREGKSPVIRGRVVGRPWRGPRPGPARGAGRMVAVLAIGSFVVGIHAIGCRAGRDVAEEPPRPSSSAAAPPGEAGASPPPPAQEQVVVRAGGEPRASASGITIRFVKVLEDSRCPVDVQCVWAGNARLALELTSKERPTALAVELNTLKDPRSIAFAGRAIEIERLSPTRRTGSEIAPTDYEAVLRVGVSPSS